MKILVADDDYDNAVTLADLLKLLGHETHYCLHGVEVLRYAEKLQPDVLFLDLVMPTMTGFDVIQQFEHLPEWRPKNVIAVTGLGDDETRQRAMEAGFDDFLLKPVSAETLTAVLDDAIASSFPARHDGLSE